MRVAALEAVGDEVFVLAAGKRLNQELILLRQHRTPALQAQPLLHRGRQIAPLAGIGEDLPNAARQVRSEGQAAAGISGNLWLAAAGGAARLHEGLADAVEAQELAGEDEGVAGQQSWAKYSSTSPSTRPRPSTTLSMGCSTMVPMFMR